MPSVIPPLAPGLTDPRVKDLIDALLMLIDRGLFTTFEPPNRPTADELRDLATKAREESSRMFFGEATRQLVLYFQLQYGLGDAFRGFVEDNTAARLNDMVRRATTEQRVVRGSVRRDDGTPVLGVTVRAFDRDLRQEQQLGEASVDRAGRYEISYTSDAFLRAEKASADLVVRAFGPDGRELVASSVLFNAPVSADVDLTLPAQTWELPTLFETIGLLIRPLLEDVKVSDLQEDPRHQDLTFLSGETGLSRDVLARFVVAHKLAELGIQPEFWFAILGGAPMSFEENRTADEWSAAALSKLPSLDTGTMNRAFARSFGLNEIPAALRDAVPKWIEAFFQLVARRAPADSPQGFLRSALEHAGLSDPAKVDRLSRIFSERRALSPEVVKVIERERLLSREQVADVLTSFRLAELSGADFTVVKLLKDTFDVRRPEEIRRLAEHSETEWLEAIKAGAGGGGITLPIAMGDVAERIRFPETEASAGILARRFREAFPTAAFAGDLRRAVRNGGVKGLRHAEAISAVVDRQDEFDLMRTRIDDFLDRTADPRVRDIAADPEARLELQAVQRVFKIAPTFPATATLLADRIHCAQQVYRMGEAEFVRGYADKDGFTADVARRVWSRAADTVAAVVTILGDLKALDSDSQPRAVREGGSTPAAFPNWNNLFKTGDFCECEHCRSVLGPAAYFADLLMFLRDRPSTVGSVKDVLFSRRPDLGYLELNCENGSTLLPYIDVVNEVLEDVVAPTGHERELSGFTAIPAGATPARQAVFNAFAQQRIKLGSDFSLSQVDPGDPDRWVVHDDDGTYLLKKTAAGPSFVARLLQNTKATAAELRAYPEYVNVSAYARLRTAIYPRTLPFDLFAEEVRASFQKTNLQRWDLMRTLRGAAAPNNPSASDIAAEYFNISTDTAAAEDEKRVILIAGATAARQQALWGESGNTAWINTVGNVNTFLSKTGLDYLQLLALLDLKFINPAGDMTVDHPESDSCDTAQKSIRPLDEAKLDRIHRFLRLWRKLTGWQMWELDLVILHPAVGGGALDEKFLIRFFHFAELRKRLGRTATVEQTLALLGDLNTQTHFTKPYEKRADGLYQTLFLNRKLIQPLDQAFAVASVAVAGPTQQKITGHRAPILAALGIREADLAIFTALKKASDGTPYITDDLTLANLSFLWRHSWLAKLLKWSADEWRAWLAVAGADVAQFTDPKAALDFIEKADFLKSVRFTPDELNWLLRADRVAKSATREADVETFLRTLRRELQAIRASYHAGQYDFLNATPTDVEQLTALLSTLLQQLHRSDDESRYFLAVLQGRVVLEAAAAELSSAFSFPTTVTGGTSNIPIQHDATNRVLRLTGVMTSLQRTALLGDTGPATTALRGAGQLEAAVTLPAGFVFPGAITGAPANIPIQYDGANEALRFTGLMSDAQRATLLADPTLTAVTADAAYRAAIESLYQASLQAFTAYRAAVDDLYQQSLAAPARYATTTIEVAAPGIALPAALPSLPLRYDASAGTVTFTGVMTPAEQTALKAVAANPAAAVDELFQLPRLAVKFFDPTFTAPLAALPASVDFSELPGPLAARVTYDDEERVLRVAGVLDSGAQAALKALAVGNAADVVAYRAAVDAIAAQPLNVVSPDPRIWTTESDLDATQGASNTLAKRLATAAAKALAYLSDTLTANVVVDRASAQLGLGQPIVRFLLTRYALLPETMLAHLTGTFAATAGVVDYATLKQTFDGWFWATRAAALVKKWNLTLGELRSIDRLATDAGLLDFATLPLDSSGSPASLSRLVSTSRLVRLRDTLPETGLTLLELLIGLKDGAYTAGGASAFARDVERVTETYTAADVVEVIASLDLAYPADYLRPESWERLGRVFYFTQGLNAGVASAKAFASATMTAAHARTVKELLRSRFGSETWLTLCAEIQDALRERKRDALASFLLAQPQPADAPTGKWENTNDLYAYYLLDVEMSSCQMTSRLVQASGSVQLFVQRCFMGLEPKVDVNEDPATGDTAWRWWAWMGRYRVWEANRKIFLWPENWIEPELRKDRSASFRDLQNELVQNEVSQSTAEIAVQHYLEKLDEVAHLEIAGFYQEDDGDETFVHVFGRTPGSEPHVYYYRRYDFRQWTPWEKVDLEIQGDYLVPAVINRRLFLFWPMFREVPDDAKNSTVTIPAAPGASSTKFAPDKTSKKLQMQMAVSEYRDGAWTPKKVSTSFDQSDTFDGDIDTRFYAFTVIDLSDRDGRFFIKYHGYSIDSAEVRKKSKTMALPSMSAWKAPLYGEVHFSGCKGAQDLTFRPDDDFDNASGEYFNKTQPAIRAEDDAVGNAGSADIIRPVSLKWEERAARYDSFVAKTTQDDFTILNEFATTAPALTPVLMKTPGIFRMSPAWHGSYMDRLWFPEKKSRELIGTWLPFFYRDSSRTFVVFPTDRQGAQRLGDYYPDIKANLRATEHFFEVQMKTTVEGFVGSLTADQRAALESWLVWDQNVTTLPPYTDAQFTNLIAQFPLGALREYLKGLSDERVQHQQFHFKTFYHPLVCDFLKLLNNPLRGIPALMSRDTQLKDTLFDFGAVYQPTAAVFSPAEYPREDVDFSHDGAYASYNWELFFHVPLLIANSLSRNQRFEEAREWYHFIFNPMGVEAAAAGASPMSKYWITKPFFQTTDPEYVQQRIENILRILAGDPTAGDPHLQGSIAQAVYDWRVHPFEPHRIANYRTVAYQKTVVMKYVDNLVAWGDYLFRQDTMESINEATQLYIMAAEILGPKPRTIPPRLKPPVQSFNELEFEFDAFTNAMVQVENLMPIMPGPATGGRNSAPLPMLYFCIPRNEKLLAHWDTVADRLYKIRHCMNIEGVVRQLALFEPPIDPAALVKAVAGGQDLSAALADLNAPLPLYRFSTLAQRANEVCGDVKALGASLIGALEKKDGEELVVLRQRHEIRLLEAVKAVREQQIEEAKAQVEGLKKSKAVVETRRDHYRDIERLIGQETLHLDKMSEAHLKAEIAQGITLGASIISYLPALDLGASGFGGTPIAKFKIGGLELGQAASLASDVLSFLSHIASNDAAMAAAKASYERRWEEWKFQERLANTEIAQIDAQIGAAEVRVAIAERELENHVRQIEDSKAVDAFMRSKYTNQELYQWQVGQISSVYFQSYKLAYDLAKRAERCYRFELGLQDSNYIQFGYWDSLKKGLLSGDKLQYDLRRLETAYIDQNRREFELTKHVSLAMLDPLALVRLRETGRCFFQLPEEIFDLDYPGHYFRRIKSVSLSLPCVVGPYTTVGCTLRLLKNNVRVRTTVGDDYARNTEDGLPADDERFVESNIPFKATAVSSAQNDSGVFDLNFRDERYLPFEGAGAISSWALELFSDLPSNNPDFGRPLRQFDYGTISDAILHVRYTAREDAGPFKNAAIGNLREYVKEAVSGRSLRLLDLRREFPTEWHRFLNPADAAAGNVLAFTLTPELFSWRDAQNTLAVDGVWLLARCADPGAYTVVLSPPLPPPPGPPTQDPNRIVMAAVNQYGGLHFAQRDISAQNVELSPGAPGMEWRLKMSRPGGGNLAKDQVRNTMEVEEVFVVLGYHQVEP